MNIFLYEHLHHHFYKHLFEHINKRAEAELGQAQI